MMNLKELKKEVKELAGRNYHSVRHYITEHTDGDILDRWDAYIDNIGWGDAATSPEGALKSLRLKYQKEKEGGKEK